jgi:hypothetical protein
LIAAGIIALMILSRGKGEDITGIQKHKTVEPSEINDMAMRKGQI